MRQFRALEIRARKNKYTQTAFIRITLSSAIVSIYGWCLRFSLCSLFSCHFCVLQSLFLYQRLDLFAVFHSTNSILSTSVHTHSQVFQKFYHVFTNCTNICTNCYCCSVLSHSVVVSHTLSCIRCLSTLPFRSVSLSLYVPDLVATACNANAFNCLI